MKAYFHAFEMGAVNHYLVIKSGDCLDCAVCIAIPSDGFTKDVLISRVEAAFSTLEHGVSLQSAQQIIDQQDASPR